LAKRRLAAKMTHHLKHFELLNTKLKTKFRQVVPFTSYIHFLRAQNAALPASPQKVALSNRKLERWKNFNWAFFATPRSMVKEFFQLEKPFFE
jgi:hypothetical protein